MSKKLEFRTKFLDLIFCHITKAIGVITLYIYAKLRPLLIFIIIRKTYIFLILVSPLLGIFSLTENIEKYFQQQFQEV